MEQQPHCACEWTIKKIKQKQKKTKVTSYSNWPDVLLFDLAPNNAMVSLKNGFSCLTSESKGRFLANNILLAWCLVAAQIKFSFIKK